MECLYGAFPVATEAMAALEVADAMAVPSEAIRYALEGFYHQVGYHPCVYPRRPLIAPKVPPGVAPAVIGSFKIIIVGDGGVGKSCMAQRLAHEVFETRYLATIGVCVTILHIPTTLGLLQFELWDTGGGERYGGLRDGYYLGSCGAILMYDATARVTYKNTPNWYRDVKRVCPDAPVVMVANKMDTPMPHAVRDRQVLFHRKKEIPLVEVSVKTAYNIEKPLLLLSRMLLRDECLAFL